MAEEALSCDHPREVIAIDSAGHEIIAPCHPCLLEWRQYQQETATPQRKVCDECGGELVAQKEGLRCLKCGQEYR